MSQFAPVVPLQIAEAMMSANIFGPYHLVLAHDIIKDAINERWYADLFTRVRHRYGADKVKIILDNSVVELGHPLPMKDLIRAYEIVNATWLVLPDIVGEYDRTIKLSSEFLAEFDQVESHLRPKVKFMGLTQGNSIPQLIKCARWYSLHSNVEAIGIPRVITKVLHTRMDATLHIWLEFAQRFNWWHLFGFSDDIIDDIACAKLPFIDGIDSAVPIRAGIEGKLLSLDYFSIGPRGKFWETAQPFIDRQMQNVQHNIGYVRSLIHAPTV